MGIWQAFALIVAIVASVYVFGRLLEALPFDDEDQFWMEPETEPAARETPPFITGRDLGDESDAIDAGGPLT